MKQPHQIMSQRIAPGIWLDAAGDPHFSIPELLAHFDIPDTPETRIVVVEIAKEVIRRASPESTIIHTP